jgi:hypothetical protein
LWLGRHDPGTEQRCAHTAEAAGHLLSSRTLRVLWIAHGQRLHQRLSTPATTTGIG